MTSNQVWEMRSENRGHDNQAEVKERSKRRAVKDKFDWSGYISSVHIYIFVEINFKTVIPGRRGHLTTSKQKVQD